MRKVSSSLFQQALALQACFQFVEAADTEYRHAHMQRGEDVGKAVIKKTDMLRFYIKLSDNAAVYILIRFGLLQQVGGKCDIK